MNLEELPKVQVYPYALNLTHSSDYFLPFSRQVVYSSMQPFSVELSVSNRRSAHSRIPLAPQYEIISDNHDLVINNCVQLEFNYEEILWPYFGSILAIIHAQDTPACRNASSEAVTIAVRFPV